MRHGNRDSNHAAIRAALAGIPGVTVADTADLGNGFPDLVVGYRGVNFLLEVKPPGPPSRQRLTPAETQWHARWRGHVAVVTSVEEALVVIGLRPATRVVA